MFGEATQVFHVALREFVFSGVGYKEDHGSFYYNIFSQPFPVFIVYSCSWRDCALGELLISLGKIIMPHYFMLGSKLYVFQFQLVLSSLPSFLVIFLLYGLRHTW